MVGIFIWIFEKILKINSFLELENLKYLSPINYAHNIKRPLLIIHGKNDIRVPIGHSGYKNLKIILFKN